MRMLLCIHVIQRSCQTFITLIFYPQALKAVWVLYLPRASSWMGGWFFSWWENYSVKAVRPKLMQRNFLLGGDIGREM